MCVDSILNDLTSSYRGKCENILEISAINTNNIFFYNDSIIVNLSIMHVIYMNQNTRIVPIPNLSRGPWIILMSISAS